MREMSRSEFLDIYLQKAAGGVLRLSCKEARERSDKKKDSAVVECLGMLGVAELLYFYSHSCKEIIITSGNCKDCVNKFGTDVLKDEIAELEVMAGYFERLKDMRAEFYEGENGEESIHFAFSDAFPPKEFTEAPSLKNEDVTRRGMFQLFGKNIADNAIRSAAMLSPQAIPSKTPIRLTKEIPVRRRLFIEAISSMGRITRRVIPISPYFFSQSIDSEKCTYCNICTRFCPTGALHGGENGELLFTAAECTACGMCLISCYHKCIKPAETIDLTELFQETVKAKKND
jgi:ferredoxin